ncbi:MAG: SGNH/GDSL hydrolase family protein [Rhizorhabdus sp.]
MPTFTLTNDAFAEIITPGPNDQTIQVTSGRALVSLGARNGTAAIDSTAGDGKVISVPSGMAAYVRPYSPGQVTITPAVITTTVGSVQSKPSGYQLFDAAAAASGLGGLFNVKPSNTAKSRAGYQRPDRNFLIACVGPSTVAGSLTANTGDAVGSWPSRFAAALQARGINAGFQNLFGARNGYGAGPTSANLKAGDIRFDFTGAGGVATNQPFDSVGGNVLGFNNAAGTMVFTPTAPVRKWKIWTGNGIAGRNLTASSGASGAVAINSVADNSITETVIDSGSSGLNALTLTWVQGNVSVLGVVGYDDTGNRREISILNWGIPGAPSARFNENVDTARGTLAMINKVKPDVAILSDLPINDWRTSVPLLTSKANVNSNIDSFLAAGTEVWLTTSRFDNANTGFSANQQAYSDAMKELALERDLPLLDLRASLVSYASANAQGRYNDPVHQTLLGHNADGLFFASSFQRIMSI